ncbi:hypothetical protein H6F86_20720 [Phormidium sp. FACHB-592]|uniref:Uncharacterized protein n=1 Tax=Stenomitos frigidus AS-A4 TaxID=2933935 RepID=A0ABV0KEZ7_9CYAN|nr:hypothetical protein [Phormidium sp. FACHB-592]MBD2076257.1 hypothetical protein [Phormidium sp. FACHB-592]
MSKNQPLILAALLAVISISGCSTAKAPEPIASTTPETIAPSPTSSPETSPSPTEAAKPAKDSNIGKVDATGTTVVVDVPDNPVCDPETTQTTKEVFETCLIESLTFVQASNVIGFKGELVSQAGTTEIRKWTARGDGVIFATFSDGKLVSKSQSNLE